MTNTPELGQRRRINWLNVNTVLCAAVLIGAEVFGAAYAGGWAIAMLLGLGDYGIIALRVLFFVLGIAVMISFVRQAQRVEPFTSRE
jgi:2-methylisocitrate lyase-like PEP mutase family enzyme